MKQKTRPTGEAYQLQAQQWDLNDILKLWITIKKRKRESGWPEGKMFEYLVVRAFELAGLTVKWPFSVTYPHKLGTMEQIDGVVYLNERPFLIESKHLSEASSIEAFAKLRLRLETRPPGTMGILFSTNDFTLATEVFAQFAHPLNILLWGRADLDIALASNTMKSSLQQKLSVAIEYGLALHPLGGPPK